MLLVSISLFLNHLIMYELLYLKSNSICPNASIMLIDRLNFPYVFFLFFSPYFQMPLHHLPELSFHRLLHSNHNWRLAESQEILITSTWNSRCWLKINKKKRAEQWRETQSFILQVFIKLLIRKSWPLCFAAL